MAEVKAAFKIKKISNGIIVQKVPFDDKAKEVADRYPNKEPEVYHPTIEQFTEALIEKHVRGLYQPKESEGSILRLSIE